MSRTAICFLAHRRPEHTAKSLSALMSQRNAIDFDLCVFIDGPRTSAESRLCEETYAVCNAAKGFRSISVTKRPENIGMARSIMESLDAVFECFDQAILIEDDILCADSFLPFISKALDQYATVNDVVAISGYLPRDRRQTLGNHAFFSRRPSCWGLGIWKRTWEKLERSRETLLTKVKDAGLEGFLNPPGGISMTAKLQAGIDGTDDSWSPIWFASHALSEGLFLYPPVSLVDNIGFDGSGEHGLSTMAYDTCLWDRTAPPVIPERVVEEPGAENFFVSFFAEAMKARIQGK